MKKNNGNIILEILSFVYCFFLMYFPDFSKFIKIDGVAVYVVLTLVMLVVLLPEFKKKQLLKIKLKNPLTVFVVMNGLFSIYYMIRTLIAGTAFSDWRALRIIQNLFPILQLFGCLLLYKALNKMGLNNDEKMDFIFKVAVIQSLIALSALFIPFTKSISLDMFYKGNSNQNIYISNGRLFGFCNGNFTYDFQVATSLIALTALNRALNTKKKKYYLISIIILIASILNGRTGTLIYLVGAMGLIIRLFIIKGKIMQFAAIVGAFCLVLPIVSSALSTLSPNTYKLFSHAIDDFGAYREGNRKGTETEQLVNGIRLPEREAELLFGAGYRIYARGGLNYGYDYSSDIGYVNDIFMAGIFFALTIYYAYVNLAIKSVKSNKKWQGQFLVFLIFMVMANTKGEMFRSQIIISVLVLLMVFIYKEKRNEIIARSTNV